MPSRIVAGLRAVGLVLFVAGFAPCALAVGLGDIEVRSALNEPLRASIALLGVAADERSAVRVQIASPEVYGRYGIQRPAILDEMSVRVVPAPASPGLKVLLETSSGVREPVLFLLLEVNSSGRKLLREYTVLLDLPVGAGGAVAVAHAESSAGAARASRSTLPPDFGSMPGVGQGTAVQRYGPVRPGETLSDIAESLVPGSGLSLVQMQAALYRANPQAFGGDRNHLLAGSTLAVPLGSALPASYPVPAAPPAATASAPVAPADEPQPAASTTADEKAAMASAGAQAMSAPDRADASDPVPVASQATSVQATADADADGGGAMVSAPILAPAIAPLEEDEFAAASDRGPPPEAVAPPTTDPETNDAGMAPDSTPESDPLAAPEPIQAAVIAPDQGNGASVAGASEPPATTAPQPTLDPEGKAEVAPGASAAVARPAADDPQLAATSAGADPAPAAPVSVAQPAPTTPDVMATVIGTAKGTAERAVTIASEHRMAVLVGLVLLLLAWLLVRRRRQYKPFPADFSDLSSDDLGGEDQGGLVGPVRPQQRVAPVLDVDDEGWDSHTRAGLAAAFGAGVAGAAYSTTNKVSEPAQDASPGTPRVPPADQPAAADIGESAGETRWYEPSATEQDFRVAADEPVGPDWRTDPFLEPAGHDSDWTHWDLGAAPAEPPDPVAPTGPDRDDAGAHLAPHTDDASHHVHSGPNPAAFDSGPLTPPEDGEAAGWDDNEPLASGGQRPPDDPFQLGEGGGLSAPGSTEGLEGQSGGMWDESTDHDTRTDPFLEPEADAETPAHATTVSEKLTLAQSYLELGMPEIAAPLLLAVREAGSAEQRQLAEELSRRFL